MTNMVSEAPPQPRVGNGTTPEITGGAALIDVVELHYASPEHHWHASVQVTVGFTIADVLRAGGFHLAHPNWDVDAAGVGIDGRLADLDTVVMPGDRVEVYRPLTFDPMVSRRRRAAHKARKAY